MYSKEDFVMDVTWGEGWVFSNIRSGIGICAVCMERRMIHWDRAAEQEQTAANTLSIIFKHVEI